MNLFFRTCKEDIDNVCVPTDEHYELPYKSETQQQPSILADGTGYQSDNQDFSSVSEDFSSVDKYRQAVSIAKDEYAKAFEVVGEESKATWMAMKTQTCISSKRILLLVFPLAVTIGCIQKIYPSLHHRKFWKLLEQRLSSGDLS